MQDTGPPTWVFVLALVLLLAVFGAVALVRRGRPAPPDPTVPVGPTITRAVVVQTAPPVVELTLAGGIAPRRVATAAVPVPGQRLLGLDDAGDPRTAPGDGHAPRGWGAGQFDVRRDPRTRERWTPAATRRLEQERALFRAGPVETARVLAVEPDGVVADAMLRTVLRLAVGDAEVTATRYLPGGGLPPVGATLLVVRGPGGAVALDSDERFDGPPGRALVWLPPV